MILCIPDEQLRSTYIVPSFRALLNHILLHKDLLARFGVEDVLVVGENRQEPPPGSISLSMGLNGVTTDIERNCRLVIFWDDLHWHNEQGRRNRHAMFRKGSLLLLPYYEHFLAQDEFREYHGKGRFFPWFSAFYQGFDPKKWLSRRSLILLSGRISDSYPLRRQLREYIRLRNLDDIRILDHPGYNSKMQSQGSIMGHEYFNYLSDFRASIATSASSELHEIDYVVAKYFEIPAAGCLLICEEVPTLQARGFIDGLNCIALDTSSPETTIEDVLHNCSAYVDIAEAGNKLVDSSHSLDCRMEQLVSYCSSL